MIADLAAFEQSVAGAWAPRRETPPMVRGRGLWLEDTEGNRYLDLTSAYGTTPLGHGHPALGAAIAEQAGRLVACPANLYCAERALFLACLERRLPARLPHVFLCNSGAEANEAAFKFARLHTGRPGLVAVEGSFHGRTAATLAATWSPQSRARFAPLLGPVTFVPRDDAEALERAIDKGVAACVVEIVQGESGVHPLAPDFLRRAGELCRERGALLVADEVQTGFGRTGAWLAHTDLGLEPDLLTLAKGIAGGFPMGALAYGPDVAASLFVGAHGSTFGGGPLASAAGRATLETIEREGLVESAKRQGERLLAALRDALDGRPLVRAIRGRGLMIGIELRRKAGPYLATILRQHRVIALPGGGNVVRLLPALVIGEEEIATAVEALAAVLGGDGV